MKTRTILLAIASVAGLAASGAGLVLADGVPCSNNTTGDRVNCTGNCESGVYIGVSINSNDPDSETGGANTACSDQTAACTFQPSVGSCSDESIGATAASAPWTCHFEAHDVWYRPDSGFTYNCYSRRPQPPTPTPSPTPPPPPPPSRCGGGPLGGDVTRDWVTFDWMLCVRINDGVIHRSVLVDGAKVQTLAYVEEGRIAAMTCVEGGCVPVEPVCVAIENGVACDVTPLTRR